MCCSDTELLPAGIKEQLKSVHDPHPDSAGSWWLCRPAPRRSADMLQNQNHWDGDRCPDRVLSAPLGPEVPLCFTSCVYYKNWMFSVCREVRESCVNPSNLNRIHSGERKIPPSVKDHTDRSVTGKVHTQNSGGKSGAAQSNTSQWWTFILIL